MRKSFLFLSFCCLSMAASAIQPLWLRDAKISPSGEQIAFTYQGDIYTVSSKGGMARRITSTPAYDSNPAWSPDGKKIAFSSDRFGSKDVFIVSAEGGNPLRLTTHSANEQVETFTADGSKVVFTAQWQDPAQSALFPRSSMTEVYEISTEGGRASQINAIPSQMIAFDKEGKRMLFEDHKGLENIWRKHHTSSVTMEIWMQQNGEFTQLTHHPGEDRNPVFAPDQQKFYFLSERDGGSMNVYVASINTPDQANPITNFKTHPVRFLSVGNNGLLCYTYNGEIYTQQPGSQPQRLNIDITVDRTPEVESLDLRNISEATVSPDGKQIAMIIRGDVWVTSVDYSTTRQITHTPQTEKHISWGADSKTLAYVSERNGKWQIFTAHIVRKEEPGFPVATLIHEEVLLPKADYDQTVPQFSPDGKEIAFVSNRKQIAIVRMADKAVRQITDGSHWYNTTGNRNFKWSPDGKWLAFEWIAHHHDPYTDIAIVRTDGKSTPIQITESGYFSESPEWVLNGNAILFRTDRYGMRSHASWGSLQDVMIVFLNQNAMDRFRLSKEDYELLKDLEKEQEKAKTDTEKNKAKGKKKKVDTSVKKEPAKDILVETEHIQDRIMRLTPNSSEISSAILNKDGEALYYMSEFENGYDLWKIDLRKHDVKLLHKLNSTAANLEGDKELKNIFILSSTSIKKMDTGSDKLTPVSFNGKQRIDHAAERAAMYEHVVQQIPKRFYRTDLHGVNWEAMTADYRRFLPHISNNHDFANLLSELLGELNVSHTGSGYRNSIDSEIRTAELGLMFEWNSSGDGLNISDIIEQGPFDRKSSRVRIGDVLTAIDGTPIKANTDFWALLNGKTNKRTLVSFRNAAGQQWDEVIKPIGRSELSLLLYKRWVKQRAEDVRRWSNGRLGYVHIESMDDDSYRTIYADILGRYNDCEGIVIDTRFNGGGRLHEDIEILFSGQEYFKQVVRGDTACIMPSRRWAKPSIMLQNEANYSNAHGTPWVYKHQHLGSLVGTPVPGTMTSVNWETLQDPTLYFGIPVTGYRLPDGSYLENQQLEPDIHVTNEPANILKGEDTQLKVAVETLLKQINSKK